MIFVSCGTVSFPFKRLVDTVIGLFKDNPNEKVIIQSGSYLRKSPANHIIIKPYFTFRKMLKYYQTADLIVSAAGEASTYLILAHATSIPIFFPRLKKYGEHVDDQQKLIGRFIEKYDPAYVAYNTLQLKNYLKRKNPKGDFENRIKEKNAETLKRLTENLNRITTV